jgi:hypothetical protein
VGPTVTSRVFTNAEWSIAGDSLRMQHVNIIR